MYITEPNSLKVIEIQLRTRDSHNWATLVEITDVLYGTRLKEEGYESNSEWGKFHEMVSRDGNLSPGEADFLYKTLEKHDFVSKLAETFRKNSSKVKRQWQKVKHRDKFFLIELSSETVPKLSSYSDYSKAEADYFEAYKSDEGALIVLTSIHKPTFELISIAYANYILSYHKFIQDVQITLKNLAIEKLKANKFSEFRKIFKLYEDIQANNIVNILFERDDVFVRMRGSNLSLGSNTKLSTKKRKEIRKQVKLGVNDLVKEHSIFMDQIKREEKNLPIWAVKTKSFLKKHENRIDKKLKTIEPKFSEN